MALAKKKVAPKKKAASKTKAATKRRRAHNEDVSFIADDPSTKVARRNLEVLFINGHPIFFSV